jgi:hypothetical protein
MSVTSRIIERFRSLGLYGRGVASGAPLPRLLQPLVDRRAYLGLLAVPIGLAFSAFLFVVAVDPFDLRPWGAKPTIRSYPERVASEVKLLNVVEASDVTVLVVGGSTLKLIGPGLLREAFGQSEVPFNISYDGPMPRDQKLVLERALRMPKLKRVIIGLDFPYLLPVERTSRYFPIRFFTRPWYDLGKDFDPRSMRAAFHLLVNRRVLPEPTAASEAEALARRKRVTDFPDLITMLARSAQNRRDQVLAPSGLTCARLPAIDEVLVLFATAAASRGIATEIVVPPYSLAAYSSWLERPPSRLYLETPIAIFDQLLTLRRCAVDKLAPIANVRVHAFDNEEAITKLENYVDTTHLVDAGAMRKMLAAIVGGSHILTPANFEAYAALHAARLRQFDIAKPR